MGLFVTGASGYLGTEICRRAGIAPPPRVEILDPEALAAALAGATAVIHTAYRQDDPRVTAEGAQNVARAAAAARARLVHLSSDVVFSGAKGAPYVEGDAPDPVTGYGHAKARAEALVAEACPGAVLVRTSLIYGGQTRSRQETFAPGMAFYADEIRCPVAVRDLAEACLELAGRPDVAGPLHVAGADPVSRLEFAALVTGRSDLPSAMRPADRPGNLTLDCSRARSLLRTRLRGAREVLAGRAG